MSMFLRIDRPTRATLRLFAIATSAACCMRWMFDAKLATRMRPVRIGISWRNASPTSRSEPVIPGRSAFVESPSIRSTPRLPDRGELADVRLEPVDGRVVELPVARVEHAPGGRLDHDRDAVGDRVRHPDELELEGADLDPVAVGVGLAERRRGAELVLVELRLHHREGQLGGDHLADLDLAENVRQRADVVLVAVREHDREQRPILEIREVRQHEVDAEVLVAREGEPGVDQDPLPVELVERHVLADLAEPAERNDAECVAHRARSVRAGLRRAGVRRRPASLAARSAATGCSNPSRSRQPRTAASSSGVASTSGSRKPPTSWPSRFIAVLIAIGFVCTRRRSIDGRSSSSIARAPSRLPRGSG